MIRVSGKIIKNDKLLDFAAMRRNGGFMANENDSRSRGRFGIYGGQYVPETLMNVLVSLEEAYHTCIEDEEFCEELAALLKRVARRPSRLYYAQNLTKELGGAQIYFKREDLNPTGSHCINSALGQVLLAKWMFADPDILILDEPTNDFDIETLTLLEDFLMNFQGCLLLVSHDRYFINKLVDHIFVLDGRGQIKDYYGNYSDYKQIENQINKNIEKQKKEVKTTYQKIKNINPNKRTYKEEKEFQELSAEIASLEEEKNIVINQLNAGNLKDEELIKYSERYSTIDTLLEEKTMRWFELSEKDG